MAKRMSLLAALAVVAALIVVPTTFAGPGRNALLAAMNGGQEVPTGDPDGFGAAAIEVRGATVCFRIIVGRIQPAVAAHIHRGAPGVAGPIVVPFFNGPVPRDTRCVRTRASLAREILRSPSRFYVNVHTRDYPAGAVRGQLSR